MYIALLQHIFSSISVYISMINSLLKCLKRSVSYIISVIFGVLVSISLVSADNSNQLKIDPDFLNEVKQINPQAYEKHTQGNDNNNNNFSENSDNSKTAITVQNNITSNLTPIPPALTSIPKASTQLNQQAVDQNSGGSNISQNQPPILQQAPEVPAITAPPVTPIVELPLITPTSKGADGIGVQQDGAANQVSSDLPTENTQSSNTISPSIASTSLNNNSGNSIGNEVNIPEKSSQNVSNSSDSGNSDVPSPPKLNNADDEDSSSKITLDSKVSQSDDLKDNQTTKINKSVNKQPNNKANTNLIKKNKVPQNDNASSAKAKENVSQSTSADISDFTQTIVNRPVYDYQNNISPPNISKKSYGENNQHLPKAFYQSEYSSLLFAAADNDDIATIKALLNKNADINATDNRNGYSPLMYAAKNNRLRALRYLIIRGANVNQQALDGKSALHVAALQNHFEIMKVLISSNADLMLKDREGRRGCDYIAIPEKESIMIELVKDYRDMNKALIDFTHIGSIAAVKYSLTQGANINIHSDNLFRDTPLIIAVKNRDLPMLSLLLMKKADPYISNSKNQNAIEVASLLGYNDVVDIIRTVIVQYELENAKLVEKNHLLIGKLIKNDSNINNGFVYNKELYPSQKNLLDKIKK